MSLNLLFVYSIVNRVVGFEVEADSRAITEYKVEGDKCQIQSDLEKKEPQPLLINDKGTILSFIHYFIWYVQKADD